MTEPKPMLWTKLTYQSSRKEVLAAVAETDDRERRLSAIPDPDFSNVPDGAVGCFTSRDGGSIGCFMGPRETPEVIRRQDAAGEEDQSTPGWDDYP